MKYNIIGIDKKDDKILITAEVSLVEFCETVDIDMNIVAGIAVAEIPVNIARAEKLGVELTPKEVVL